jgi:predicted phosphodiesterase
MKKIIISACIWTFTVIFAQSSGVSALESTKEIPKLQIPVMSDIHIRNQESVDYFKKALNDMLNAAPNYKAVALVGDITDGGTVSQYDNFMRILNGGVKAGAEKVIAMGNHEYAEIWYGSSTFDNIYLKRFSDKTAMPKVYYDKWVEGYHFLTLGGERLADSNTNDAILSEQQYIWLEKTISINADIKKPIFVFLHQPIPDTVYGSEYWHGNLVDNRLYNILSRYPQVILFSGHSHNLLDHPRTVYQDRFTMVNTGSVSYTWYNGGFGPRGYSQGLLVNVYDDKVEIKSREFSNSSWIKTFTVKIPFQKTIQDDIKPTFKKDAVLKIDNVSYESASVSWDAAVDNVQTDGYIIKCNGSEYKTQFVEYWKETSGKREQSIIGDLIPGKQYKLEVYALDAWRNVSEKPLEIMLSVPLPRGWAQIRDKWYYYGENGEKKLGWLSDANNWYYMNENGERMSGWVDYYDSWYYMNNSGIMQKGWIKDGDNWFYLTDSGYMKKGWLLLNGIWYYLNQSGEMKTGWFKYNESWYYLGEGGDMRKGWLLHGGSWYYLSSSGNMVTGWQNINGKRYYFDTSGAWRK